MTVGLPYKIEIKENEDDNSPEEALEKARKIALEYYYDEKYEMQEAIAKAADETGVDIHDLASSVANGIKKYAPVFETNEEREKRAVESGDAMRDSEGNVRYYDDRESGR